MRPIRTGISRRPTSPTTLRPTAPPCRSGGRSRPATPPQTATITSPARQARPAQTKLAQTKLAQTKLAQTKLAQTKLAQTRPAFIPTNAPRGVTLVELLVVIAMIGVMVSLLLPAIQAARESMRRTQCQNHLRQQGLALSLYTDVNGSLPPGWNTMGHAWNAMILPFLEQSNLFDMLLFQEDGAGNWEAGGANTRVIQTVVPLYRCPSMPLEEHLHSLSVPNRVPGSYRGNAGSLATSDDQSTLPVPGTLSLEDLRQNGLFFACSQVRLADITDGLSQTLAVVESRTDPRFVKDGQSLDFWYIGSPQVDDCRCDGGTGGTEFSEFVGTTYAPLNATRREPALSGLLLELSFGSYHAGGAYALRADGSVSFLDDNIAQHVLRALSSRATGEPTS
jgi:prepilin-type N-terminal cleavage/methylation domain-containing protein